MKNGVKNIQTTCYNGARTVVLLHKLALKLLLYNAAPNVHVVHCNSGDSSPHHLHTITLATAISQKKWAFSRTCYLPVQPDFFEISILNYAMVQRRIY